ncbi:hypothetical protein XENTR_v10020822 [Xenopus tropicalis]|uniref:Uncharacterized protein LOC100492545 isoform X2 n=1 Tax=Xenopus tropicalis TaxID=8364 RepID=A0A8J0QQH3_XENTR|nr:uncharacterized protein LOC100492545 isoform X2 [Xenopus tropicalis]KAE8584098.1 hypothetical protein XENTR_v10020822 [Xenopus tropicalis]|eukprot:XP_002934929.2 PREDICTED: uncharacterized protein LOC100492545 isoform X2 [Xenopus tropicalis]
MESGRKEPMMMMNLYSKEAGSFKDGSFIIDEEKQMTGISKLRCVQKGEAESKTTNKNPNSPRKNSSSLGDSSIPSILDEAFPKIREAYEMSEGTSVTGNKFFSTPLPTGTKAKKKLTPVLEVDLESNEDWSVNEKATPNVRIKKTYSIVAQESPMQAPLYRSFFAAECQDIVDQLEGKETEGRCAGKRKVEELDVSSIDAEPPPYDCTPMKSMLACEVANIIRSLDSSPANEGPSMLGDSLLDLEKLDLQLHDFNLKDKGKLCGRIQALNSSTEGIFFLGEGTDGVCSSKKQKLDPMKETKSIVNNLSNSEEKSYSNSPLLTHGHSGSKSVVNGTRLNVPQEMKRGGNVEKIMNLMNEAKMEKGTFEGRSFHAEHVGRSASSELSSKKTEADFILPTNTTVDMEITNEAVVTTQVIKSVRKLSSTPDLFPVSKVSNANTTQDLVPVRKVPDANTTQDLFPVSKVLDANTTQDLFPVSKVPDANTTQDLVPVSKVLGANTTQDLVLVYKVPDANTTQLIEAVPLALIDATQDIIVAHDEVLGVNATQEIETLQKTSANTTQDIVLEEGAAANSTQVIETGLQASANTTLDILHDEVIVANTTQVIEAPYKSSPRGIIIGEVTTGNTTQVTDARTKASANTTQDIVLEHNVLFPLKPAIAQVTRVVPKMTSFNTTQDVLSDPEDVACTQKADTVPKMICSNTTQDILLEPDETTGAQATNIMPKITSSNTTLDIVLEPEVLIATQITDAEAQFSSSNTTQEILPEVNTVNVSKLPNTMLNVTSSNTTNDIVPEPAVSKMCSETLIKDAEPTHNDAMAVSGAQTVEAVSKLSASTTQEITIVDEKVNTSNTTVCNNMKDPLVNSAAATSSKATGEAPVMSPNVSFSPNNSPVSTIQVSASERSVNNIKNSGDAILVKDQQTFGPVCTSDPAQDTALPEVARADSLGVLESSQVQMPVTGVTQVSQESISMANTLTEGKEESSNMAVMHQISGKAEDNNKSCETTSSSCHESDKLSCHEPTGDMGEMEPCEVAQETEATHDESVFSVSSLSFVTSTPLPGLSNFQFKKSSQDSTQHDPNLSVCSVVDESANKASEEEREKSHQAQGGKHLGRETTHVAQLPRNPQRSFLPQARALQSGTGIPSSGIPSARRSLALTAAPVPQKLTKEQVLSQIPPRGTGIPARGSIRPPLTRNSLVRASVGNAKPSAGSSAANTSQNRTIGSRFRTPRAAAAKARPSLTHAQITNNASVIRPPSRLSAPSSAQVPKDATCAPALSIRPAVPSGVQSFGLLRHAPSSVRPPIPLQRTGLAMKKPQREISVTTKNETQTAPRNAQLEASCASGEPARPQEIVSPSESPGCLHLETCPCCHIKYQELLQKFEELRNRLGENVRQ